MSVTRINEFQAQESRADDLRTILDSVLPTIESSPGCISCRLLQNRDEPARLVMLEVWESAEAHQAAVRAIPPSAFEEAMKLLAGPPKGAYYS